MRKFHIKYCRDIDFKFVINMSFFPLSNVKLCDNVDSFLVSLRAEKNCRKAVLNLHNPFSPVYVSALGRTNSNRNGV